MTARAGNGPSKVTEVVADLQALSSTTAQTLRLLRALLGLDIPETGIKAAPKRPQSTKQAQVIPKKTTKVRVQTAKTREPTKSTEFQIYESPECTTQPLSHAGQRKLATEAFNASLKCLTVSVKNRQREPSIDQTKTVNTPARQKTRTPLQQSSPNRRVNPGQSQCQSHELDKGIEVVAECASAALDSLRQLQENDGTQKPEDIFRREQGSLALLDKLISLNLVQEAFEQVTRIHEQYWKRRKGRIQSSQKSRTAKTVDVSPYLILDSEHESAAEFQFVTSFQSQLLRLAVALGPVAIVPKFVDAIRIDCRGGPSATIIKGIQSGFHDKEKAGQQLRTVSLAVLKLYSQTATQEGTTKSQALDKFHLLNEALSVRCKSWYLLNHRPDLQVDLWCHVKRGIRRFVNPTSSDDKKLYITVQQHVVVLRKTVADCGFNTDLPKDLALVLADLAEATGHHDDCMELLEQQTLSKSIVEAYDPTIAWRKAVTISSGSYKRDCDMLTTLQNALETFKLENLGEISLNKPDIILNASKLRRACSAIVTDIDTSTKSRSATTIEIEIQVCSVHILMKLLGFVSQAYQSIADEVCSRETQNKSDRKGILMALAKSLESILLLDSLSLTGLEQLRDEYNSSVQHCVVLMRDLQQAVTSSQTDVALVTFVQSLPVRLSNLYWTRYVRLDRQQISNNEAFELLEACITVLRNQHIDIQQMASYGIKLEKLATEHVMNGNITGALQALNDAINHYVESGAITEAVRAALTKPSYCVWSKTNTKAYPLGKAISSYVKLTLAHDLRCPSTNTWLYDNKSLLPMQRCLLFEIQLHTVTDQLMGTEEQRQTFISHTKKVLELCSESQYQVWKCRFVLNLLHMVCKLTNLSPTDIIGNDEIIKVTTFVENDVVELLSYKDSIATSLKLQWALLSANVGLEMLVQHNQSLSLLVQRCSDLETLMTTIDDLDFCFNLMRSSSSYARMQDCPEAILQSLTALKHIIDLRFGVTHFYLVPILTQLGVLHNRLGNTTEAVAIFRNVEDVLAVESEPTLASICAILGHVELLMNLNDLSKVESLLQTAFVKYNSICQPPELVSGRKRLDQDSVLCWAANIASQIAFRRGNLLQAIQFARQAVKISAAIWRAIEHSEQSTNDSGTVSGNDTSLHLLCGEMTNLTISSEKSPSKLHDKGTAYWDYVDRHYAALFQLFTVSVHCGLYQDALFYCEQLQQVAKACGSAAWTRRGARMLALLHAKAGHTTQALQLLNETPAIEDNMRLFENQQAIIFELESLLETGDWTRASTIIPVLKALCTANAKDDSIKQSVDHNGQVGLKKAPVRGKTKVVRPTKTAAKHPAQRSVPKLAQEVSAIQPRISLTSQQSYIQNKLRTLENIIQSIRGDISNESGQDKAFEQEMQTSDSTECQIAISEALLQQALHDLSSDAVKCVLAETAVALPVRYRSSRKSGRMSFFPEVESLATGKPSKAVRSKMAVELKKPVPAMSHGERLLLQAYKILNNLGNNQMISCPSDVLHLAGHLRLKLSLLTSTMDTPLSMSSMGLVLNSLHPKDLTRVREQVAIKAEQNTNDKAKILTWPTSLTTVESENGLTCSTENLINDIAALPASWSIISLSLSDNKQEILLSKISADRSPFLLRIPLTRSEFEIDSEEEFTYEEATTDLTDIITNANALCHDPRGYGDKVLRKAWYAERESLDIRLHGWLTNIENIWLGGFRGLMNSHGYSDEITKRFGLALSKTLDNHLPSRQKSGKMSSETVTLHTHVLELFLGLGHPDNQELDDAITDLLYFVVDILQFGGERNAYDEIDFDAMLVEVIDSLCACHELLLQEKPSSTGHIILILDKELTAIPWESLPCLQNQSISRMPSLVATVERLRKIRMQNSSADGYTVPVNRGAYMLNPSSDLISTENTFKPILQNHLPNFEATINKAPSESEFETALTNNDLFLYFGHGAGAQYIRGRKIRNFDSCAVTLLMGCSSAKLTECGKFESYGMPGYYINGLSGCMAVVGTLWDVTDRDIDRFALKLMVEWGLIPEDDEAVLKALEKPGKKMAAKKEVIMSQKGKNKITSLKNNRRRGIVSLDEAVRKGREACALRYLNGAAPVVYGVPVYLE